MHTSIFPNLSIRLQLIVLAILLTLPSLGIIIYTGLKDRDHDYRKAVVESQKLADHLAAEQESLVHEARQLGSFLAELPDVLNRNTDKVQSIISNTLQKNPQFTNILITDSAGNVWISATPFSQPLSVAERRYFKSVRATRQFSSGEFMTGHIVKKPTISMAYPLIEKNVFLGAVIICFDLDVLKSILKRSQLPYNSNYILVDHNGIIISRGTETGRKVGESILPADLKKMEAGPDQDTYEFIRSDGDRRIVSYRKLRLPGEQAPYIYVRAGISIKAAVAEANRQLLYNIGIMVPFVLVALLLAIFIGKRSIADRVKQLQKASQRLSAGDLKTRVGDQVGGGELGELGFAFDEMARTLEKNIAERQAAQEDLADKQLLLETLNQSLEERIKTAVTELRQKDQTLIQQNRLAAMGEMINNIAHQWRQPLNQIGLIVQSLPEYKHLSQAEMDHAIDQIMNIIKHMSQTIDDFRNFFHQDKKKTEFVVNQAVSMVLELLRPALTAKGISISITEQPEVSMFGYSNEYAQVLLILLNNAMDALVEQNVAAPRIDINITRTNAHCVVTIADNGGGISTDVMPKIFDPYFTTKEKTKGTGIGLYMSKVIIDKNMGGTLTARNIEGGVEFRIEV